MSRAQLYVREVKDDSGVWNTVVLEGSSEIPRIRTAKEASLNEKASGYSGSDGLTIEGGPTLLRVRLGPLTNKLTVKKYKVRIDVRELITSRF